MTQQPINRLWINTIVETTTGPLGQGVAVSVGMAMAGRWMAVYFNRPDFEMFDYDVYALCGDGDMMEGVSHEAASLAGHLKLANLCWIYDKNHTTISIGMKAFGASAPRKELRRKFGFALEAVAAVAGEQVAKAR